MLSLVSVNVHVERPQGVLLCQVFGYMESWLDFNNIEPLNYRLTGGKTIGLDVCFGDAEQATLFRAAFAD